jgi:hypothetical protein
MRSSIAAPHFNPIMNLKSVFFIGAAVAASHLQVALAQGSCNEGCTPGYWQNHVERWDGLNGDDFTQTVRADMSFNAVFGVDQSFSGLADTVTLLDALLLGGGGLEALNRHAAAALASADSVCYPASVGEVIDLYRDAVDAIPGPETIASVHLLFEGYNQLGCPLDNNTPPPPPRYFCVADQGDCGCGGDSLLAGCVNSTGLGARLEAEGSSSVTSDDLTLVATQLPANTTVLMLMAMNTSRLPFGDGTICIAGMSKIFRLPPALDSGPTGTVTGGPGYVALSNTIQVPVPGGIQAGDTWNFQAFYRDVAGCTGFNISNGVSVTFAP